MNRAQSIEARDDQALWSHILAESNFRVDLQRAEEVIMTRSLSFATDDEVGDRELDEGMVRTARID